MVALRRWVSLRAMAAVVGLGTLVLAALPAQAQDPSVVKTAPASAAAGATIDYTIVVSNIPGDSAQLVVMTDVLPASTAFVSATPTQGACAGTTTVICNLGNIPGAASATVVIRVTIAAGASGVISNTATIASGGPDIGPFNNTSTATTTVAGGTTGTPTDSERLAAMQAAAAKLAGQLSGAAIGGAVDGAVGDAFGTGGGAVTLGPGGVRISFAADDAPSDKFKGRVPDAFAALGPPARRCARSANGSPGWRCAAAASSRAMFRRLRPPARISAAAR